MALGDELADESGRTSIKLTYQPPGGGDDDEDYEDDDTESPDPVTTVLCSLTPGKASSIGLTNALRLTPAT